MKLRFEKLNKPAIVKSLVVLAIILAVEITVAFCICAVTENTAYEAAYLDYADEASASAEQVYAANDALGDHVITVNGNSASYEGGNYSIDTAEYANLQTSDFVIITLDELLTSYPKGGAAYIAKRSGDAVYLHSISELATEIGATSADFAVLTDTGRVLGSSLLSGNVTSYASDYTGGASGVYLITVNSTRYAAACTPIADTGYSLIQSFDFTARQAQINSMRGKVAGATAAAFAISFIALAACVYMFAASGKGTRYVYRFEVDSFGRVTDADKAFRERFPSVEVIPDDVFAYDASCYNAIKLHAVDGDVVLACSVNLQRNGRMLVYASELNLSQYGVEKRNVMQDVFTAFTGDGKRVLVGSAYFVNLETITTMFGKRFGEKVRDALIQKCQEEFTYVYAQDYNHAGILFPEGKELDRLLKDLPQITDYINQPVRVDNNLVNVEVRFGFALCDSAMKNLTFDYANLAVEAALKRTEETGESNYYVYHESQKKLYTKYFIDYDIEQMLQSGAFEMEFQPQYSLREKRIVGFESLFRIKKSASINVNVFDLITYAERSGYMIPLGDFIFDTSMAFAKQVEDMGVTVSLNVSPVQFMQAGFVDNFLRLYRSHNIKPGVVCIEITESFLMTTFDTTLKKINILRENGMEFHLDDFGTRYSSLLYLKKLPISAIKIDMEFIRDICENKYSSAITDMIIRVSNELGIYNIAEGVETEEQVKLLESMGCAVIQGWYIGKSMPAEKAMELLGAKSEEE